MNGDFDVEIGCGVGLHPIRWSLANPSRTLLAFERTTEKFQKFQRRLDRHPQVRNVIAVHGCGVAWLSHLSPGATAGKIYLLYPNPCPKESQSNQRWHRAPAMALLREILRPGGCLELATNEEWYFQEAREWLTGHWNFRLESAHAVEPGATPRTHFERKYLARGERCWNLLVSKPS